MEIVASCKDVGAGESHIGKSGPVRASPNWLGVGSDALLQHCFACYVYDVEVWLNPAPHIVVLVLKLHVCSFFTKLPAYRLRAFLHYALLALKQILVVVPYYIGKACLVHIALAVHKMEEALIAFRFLRTTAFGEQRVEKHSHSQGIFHLSFLSSLLKLAFRHQHLKLDL